MLLKKEDLNTHLYEEVISTISRDEEDLIEESIEAAEGEAIGYLERFNTDVIFGKTEDDRDKTLLMYLKDMTVWNFLAVANPDTDLEYRKKRYDNAISWFSKIQAGRITPKGWDLSTVTSTKAPFAVTSQTKRTTNY